MRSKKCQMFRGRTNSPSFQKNASLGSLSFKNIRRFATKAQNSQKYIKLMTLVICEKSLKKFLQTHITQGFWSVIEFCNSNSFSSCQVTCMQYNNFIFKGFPAAYTMQHQRPSHDSTWTRICRPLITCNQKLHEKREDT